MKLFFLLHVLIFSSFVPLSLGAIDLFTIKGNIDGITGNHSVYISLFDKKGWENGEEDPLLKKQYYPDQIEGENLFYSLTVQEGRYLLVSFEDIDGNGEMTCRGLLRIPEEPFAFYREFNPFLALRKPGFSEICFSLDKNIYNADMRMVKR